MENEYSVMEENNSFDWLELEGGNILLKKTEAK